MIKVVGIMEMATSFEGFEGFEGSVMALAIFFIDQLYYSRTE